MNVSIARKAPHTVGAVMAQAGSSSSASADTWAEIKGSLTDVLKVKVHKLNVHIVKVFIGPHSHPLDCKGHSRSSWCLKLGSQAS